VAGTGPIGGQQTGPLASIRDPVSSGSCPQALEQIDEALDAGSVDPRLPSVIVCHQHDRVSDWICNFTVGGIAGFRSCETVARFAYSS
jgi:hypothetical protein